MHKTSKRKRNRLARMASHHLPRMADSEQDTKMYTTNTVETAAESYDQGWRDAITLLAKMEAISVTPIVQLSMADHEWIASATGQAGIAEWIIFRDKVDNCKRDIADRLYGQER